MSFKRRPVHYRIRATPEKPPSWWPACGGVWLIKDGGWTTTPGANTEIPRREVNFTIEWFQTDMVGLDVGTWTFEKVRVP